MKLSYKEAKWWFLSSYSIISIFYLWQSNQFYWRTMLPFEKNKINKNNSINIDKNLKKIEDYLEFRWFFNQIKENG